MARPAASTPIELLAFGRRDLGGRDTGGRVALAFAFASVNFPRGCGVRGDLNPMDDGDFDKIHTTSVQKSNCDSRPSARRP